jgi:hypothetical protein
VVVIVGAAGASSAAGEEELSEEVRFLIASGSLVDEEKSTCFLTGAVAGA